MFTCMPVYVCEPSSIAAYLVYPDRVSELNQEFANTASQAIRLAPRILHIYILLELWECRSTPTSLTFTCMLEKSHTHNLPLYSKCFNY